MRALSLRRLLRRQRGVSYSLSFVLVIPLYLTVMLFTVEAGLLVITRIGVQYAAHAGARSAVVWQSAQPAELREERIRQGVVQALAAFIGGGQRELDDAGPVPPEAAEQAADWAEWVRKFMLPAVSAEPGLQRPIPRPHVPSEIEFMKRKYLSTAGRTTVTVKPADTDPHGAITVTVQLRAPLYIPVVSRFLDRDMSAPFEYPLEATVTLPNDAPLSKDGTLGIQYQSYRP